MSGVSLPIRQDWYKQVANGANKAFNGMISEARSIAAPTPVSVTDSLLLGILVVVRLIIGGLRAVGGFARN
jgi:hypothetical protein